MLSVLHVCMGSRVEAASELVQTLAWLCPVGYVLVSSLGIIQASPFKGTGCPLVLTAVGLFFIVLEALLKCPQASASGILTSKTSMAVLGSPAWSVLDSKKF